jgi:hypothetical protein
VNAPLASGMSAATRPYQAFVRLATTTNRQPTARRNPRIDGILSASWSSPNRKSEVRTKT